MTEARKNLIVSHGGKHGPTSATFLRGQRIDPEMAPHVPKGLKTESDPGSPMTPLAAPAPAQATPAGPPVPADPTDPAKPGPAAGAQTPAPPANEAKADAKPAAPATLPVPAVTASRSGKRTTGNLPSTRKGVQKLDRTAAMSLARDLGLEFSDETPVEDIHERLVKALSIE
jgi:hypothetical protein